ncbi:MAG TPA: cell wall hydrolase, partial [Candidatus Caccomorpha excrementavium]|nr:cell wall hydrolase [Candidatus Caccomorpha excrementavium]
MLPEAAEKAKDAAKKEEESVDVAARQSVFSVTQEEVEILQRIVEAEATGQDVKGKILVANVVLNRVMSDGFPDTIEEVVFQRT